MSRNAFLTTVLLLAGACHLSGCNNATADAPVPAADGRLRVVATTGMVADLVQIVAGERAEVTGLMGAGIDPHLFKPTRNDVKQLLDADVVFYSGLMLEGRMGETFAQLARSGKKIYAVTQALDHAKLRAPPEFAGHWDPHVWMDVSLWSECVQYVADTLAEFDPPHAAEYRSRAAAYRTELAQLDDEVSQAIRSIPEENRVLVTAHDAFGYFGHRYGIAVRSVQGVTTESEAGIQDVNHLVDFLVKRRLPALFVESSVNSKNLQAVIEGCRSRGVTVAIGGELYSDAMGSAGTYEGAYVGMIDANVTRITRALGGTTPAAGLRGKLPPTESGR